MRTFAAAAAIAVFALALGAAAQECELVEDWKVRQRKCWRASVYLPHLNTIINTRKRKTISHKSSPCAEAVNLFSSQRS